MGVYIKGMEMPKSCCACYLKMNCDDCEGYECVCLPLRTKIGYLDDLLTDKRRDDCPLVLVPPHGRLIDADAFLALVNDSTILSDFLKCIISPLIRGEPTVIEAEEGE